MIGHVVSSDFHRRFGAVLFATIVASFGFFSSLEAASTERLPLTDRAKLAAVDQAISRLTNETLIDRLQDEAEQGAGTHATAWVSDFFPLDVPPRFTGGVVGARAPAKSMLMVELTRRGVGVIPNLLAHLSDARPTKLTVGTGRFPIMAAWFSDEYDFRFPETERQLRTVNTVGLDAQRSFSNYTLKVGDLCYVALGAIVNRQLLAVRYQPSGCLVVNSPVEYPALARAAQADWGQLSETEHERSLHADLESQRLFWRSSGAISRLLFFYPGSGKGSVERLLMRPVFDRDAVYDFVSNDLKGSAPERQALLLDQFRANRGVKYVAGLRTVLEEMAWDNEPHRAESQKEASELLARFPEKLRTSDVLAVDVVDYRSQERLVSDLEAFGWPELDAAILRLFRGVVQEGTPNSVGGRIARGDLALSCAQRLVRHPEAGTFATFFKEVIAQLKRDDAAEVQLPLGPARRDTGHHAALTQRIALYGEFLRGLAPR